MKTTLELEDTLYRTAEKVAARRGCTFEELVAEALSEKVSGEEVSEVNASEPAWMKYFGIFGKTEEDRVENRRIQAAIDAEFGVEDPS